MGEERIHLGILATVVYVSCLTVAVLAGDHEAVEVGTAHSGKILVQTLHITSKISYRFATTHVTSRLHNDAKDAKEIGYEVQLPQAAFICNFSMLIDNKIYPGVVKEKEKAKKEYEKAKSRGQSAGHVAAKSRTANKFRVSVNIAGGEHVTFNLTYQELLKRRLGHYEHVIYIDPGQTVPDMIVQVVMLESKPIASVLVPPIKDDLLTSGDGDVSNDLVMIERLSPETAYIRFAPTPAQQQLKRANGIQGQFVVRYDVERDNNKAGDVLVVNGYFVHFLAPKGLKGIPRDVMFVLDVSGSMGGTKILQMKDAMRVILPDLHKGDRFSMATFSSIMMNWREAFQEVNHATMSDALNKIDSLDAGGGTNMYSGIIEGIKFFRHSEAGRAKILVFLSDGEATEGITDGAQIIRDSVTVNDGVVAVFGLAFGAGADYELIKDVSLRNNGMARKIYEDSDATLQLAGFYDEISTPLLSDVKIRYIGDGVDQQSVTQQDFYNYYNGSEIVVAGKLNEGAEVVSIKLQISANDADGVVLAQDLVYPTLALSQAQLAFGEDVKLFTRKLWAYLTITQLLQSLDRIDDVTEIAEIKTRALDLSLKYGFVTDMTSMVVTKPDSEQVASEGEDDGSNDDASTASPPHSPTPAYPYGSIGTGGTGGYDYGGTYSTGATSGYGGPSHDDPSAGHSFGDIAHHDASGDFGDGVETSPDDSADPLSGFDSDEERLEALAKFLGNGSGAVGMSFVGVVVWVVVVVGMWMG